jgi:endo-1,4-beta-mannosidase
VKVIVTLANQWADCDQGYGYKTQQWYASGYKTVDPQGTVSYRDYVAQIVQRYKDNPAVLMWQLVNEGEDRNADGTCHADAEATLKAWAADVSGLIKSIDPKHLVSLGTMGWGPCGTSGSLFQDLHSLATIDVCEVHDYGHVTESVSGAADPWNGIQAEINYCRNVGKPIFVGENGILLEAQAGGSLSMRASYFDNKLNGQFAAGMVGELVWAWSAAGSTGYDVGPGDPTLSVLAKY